MIPDKRSPIVEIPITFDSKSKPQGLTNDKFVMTFIVFGVWLFISILLLFVELTIFQKFLYIVLLFIGVLTLSRFVFLRETYFKKKRNELVEKDYQYSHSVFWNIYEITNGYPSICRYANGKKAIFVQFDKDVIVGREPDAEYYHFEAISDAYMQMHKRGIDCMHIDYMDTVGKDERVKCLFDMASDAENADLKDVLIRIFDNVEYVMQHSYASYDVYCFFYQGKDELFMDELEVVLDAFLEANYIRYRLLGKDEIGELVKSVFNLNDFSVRESSERLFADLGGTHYLTPIWVERTTSNGVERVTLNKTSAQKEAERATREAEKDTRRGRKRNNKQLMETDLESFDMVGSQDSYGYPQDLYNPVQENDYNANYNMYNPDLSHQKIQGYAESFDEVIEDMNFGDVDIYATKDVEGDTTSPMVEKSTLKSEDELHGLKPKVGGLNYNIEDDDEDLEIL